MERNSLSTEELTAYINKKKSQVWQLLPMKENPDEDWEAHLSSLLAELRGLMGLDIVKQSLLVEATAKLFGLYETEDFLTYRRVVFETMSVLEKMVVYHEQP